MNTKLHLALIGVSILLVAAACSSAEVSSSAVEPVQPALRNDKAVALIPITGEQSLDVAQDLQAYPSQSFHSRCVSEDSQRQINCADKEPSRLSGSTLLAGTANRTYPNQQVHRDCVSENSQRQNSCLP